MRNLLLLVLLPSMTSAASLESTAVSVTGEPSVAALVTSLAQPAPASTDFTEVRWLGVLARPIVLAGELRWLGEGHLERHVLKPYVEHTVIDQGMVVVRRAGEPERRFDLQRAPQLGGVLAGFEGLLSGDAEALQRVFEARVTTTADGWKLVLKPQRAELAESIRGLVAYGEAKHLRCLRMDETDGDLAVILLGDLATTKLPDKPQPSALIRLCSAEGKAAAAADSH